MISKLELLIDQHIDDPERLGTLLMLHESITDAIKAYEATIVAYTLPSPLPLTIPAQGLTRGGGRCSHVQSVLRSVSCGYGRIRGFQF